MSDERERELAELELEELVSLMDSDLWLDDLLRIGLDRSKPELHRRAALKRAYMIVITGEKRKRGKGRPKKKPGSGSDFYPMLLMHGERHRTGETRPTPLARLVYAKRHDPEFAEHDVDLKGCEESVIRRWARQWKKKEARK